MTDSNPKPDDANKFLDAPPSPLRCLIGGTIAGVFAYGSYLMMTAIAVSFATKPLQSDNFTVQRIGAAVRTLVVGLSALGTGVFGLAAIGLLALGAQLWLQNRSQPGDS